MSALWFLHRGRLAALVGTLAATALLALPPATPARAEAPQNENVRLLTPFEPVEVATAKGVLVLEMEVARNDEDRTRGLMHRKSMPERHGMLFDFESEQPIFMWMKNTYIPLDMLFIRKDGTIIRIEEMTTPHSLRTIASGEPARAVIELNGGAASRLGIAPGDKVAHPVFQSR